MTATLTSTALAFDLPPERIATAPIEAAGRRRDEARLLVARRARPRGPGDRPALVDAVFAELPRFLRPGDVLVVNTSATLAAALPTEDGRLLHLSTQLPGGTGGSGPQLPGGTGGSGPQLPGGTGGSGPQLPGGTGGSGPQLPGGTGGSGPPGGTGGLWVVELRRPCGSGSLPDRDGRPGQTVPLPGRGRAELLAPFPVDHAGPARLWVSVLRVPLPLAAYLDDVGRPIRYGCGQQSWPTAAYQTVFASEPGSAEMPSAARGFTPELVTALVTAGVVFAPLTLHTGVSSLEAGEAPYPERYRVPSASARLVNAARRAGGRVIAVGTTSARALETVADERGLAHPGAGWTELVVTPERGVRLVDGIITGWHEPEASHLLLLDAVGGRALLEQSYAHALAAGYRWHEFGDFHLILPP